MDVMIIKDWGFLDVLWVRHWKFLNSKRKYLDLLITKMPPIYIFQQLRQKTKTNFFIPFLTDWKIMKLFLNIVTLISRLSINSMLPLQVRVKIGCATSLGSHILSADVAFGCH